MFWFHSIISRQKNVCRWYAWCRPVSQPYEGQKRLQFLWIWDFSSIWDIHFGPFIKLFHVSRTFQCEYFNSNFSFNQLFHLFSSPPELSFSWKHRPYIRYTKNQRKQIIMLNFSPTSTHFTVWFRSACCTVHFSYRRRTSQFSIFFWLFGGNNFANDLLIISILSSNSVKYLSSVFITSMFLNLLFMSITKNRTQINSLPRNYVQVRKVSNECTPMKIRKE